MLIQIELDNAEQALTRLRTIERTIRDLFPAVPADAATATEAVPAGGPYRPVLTYLSLVRELIENPATAHTHDFGNRVTHLPPFISQEREDLQVISFYSWLRARTLGRPYYNVLLEIANA
ncbi:hypothetical protein [Hymenobacter siberiensis]|uniref:hypothetical protein n=1 Tax=Hymenobacter siberiensis TaxID=2848396 RepID=UPI001C1E1F82|nr:hypothetical protein [Hymenobacter siberiensis]